MYANSTQPARTYMHTNTPLHPRTHTHKYSHMHAHAHDARKYTLHTHVARRSDTTTLTNPRRTRTTPHYNNGDNLEAVERGVVPRGDIIIKLFALHQLLDI